MEIVTYLYENATAILAAILATQALAQVIVNLTPTPADDAFVGKVYKAIEKIAGIWTNTAKELPGERGSL